MSHLSDGLDFLFVPFVFSIQGIEHEKV
jgi:hypothetical protein